MKRDKFACRVYELEQTCRRSRKLLVNMNRFHRVVTGHKVDGLHKTCKICRSLQEKLLEFYLVLVTEIQKLTSCNGKLLKVTGKNCSEKKRVVLREQLENGTLKDEN